MIELKISPLGRKIKKKVVLYNPVTDERFVQRNLQLGLLAISSILNKKGYEVIIIYKRDKSVSEIIELCKDAVCFGVTTMTGYQIKDGLRISKEIKKIYKDLPIVWGGWHPSVLPIQTLKNKVVDIVVIGQGQRTFYELVKSLYNKKDIKNVKGICFKRNKEIIVTEKRELESINNFPQIPYEIINIENFIFKSEIGERTLSYFSSQGCPYNCSFCEEQTIFKRRWLPLKASRVVNDIKNLYDKYKLDALYIIDM